MGTPVYFSQVTGPVKLLIDRLFSLKNSDFTSKLKPGKRIVLASTQGVPDESIYEDYLESTGKILGGVGFDDYQVLKVAAIHNIGDINNNQQALKKARKVGQWLVNG